MRSLSLRLWLFSVVTFVALSAFAHDVTLTGTNSFASLDGSSSDHDGTANGVFTVNDGNLVVNGVVNCNDDVSTNACSMAFNVSGNMSVNTGGALYAENRSGSGTGGAITLTVGGNLALNGNAIVSTASKTSSGATGGAITANVSGSVSLASGATIDSGSANAAGGAILVAAGGTVSVDGSVLSGPSRTLLSTRLSGGAALDGGTSNNVGGAIAIGSSTFAEPSVVIGSTANVISQGSDNGAGPVTIDGCGIQVYGLIAALSRKAGAAKVVIRSGKDILVDGRDLGGSGTRMGRIRADAPTGTALNKGVDLFAAETIDVFGPAGSSFVITSLPGLHDSKSYGGLIRATSLGDAVNMSGNAIDDGHTASGDSGGTVEIAAKEDVNLNTAVIRAHGDFNTNNNNRGGGKITVRSYSGDVIWTNGTGDVRPVGSTSNLPLADQGKIILTACGTVNTTGSSFPVNGTATSMFPETYTGVCSPAAPSLPAGTPALITCNTPPVANDASVTTNEDTTVTITLSGTDADGDPLTFSIVSGPSNGSLGPIIPTGPTSATVDYTPNLNFNGSDSFVYQANDGNGGTDNATVTITVVPVNDPPSFLAGPTVTVLEDSGAQTFTNWATSISAGPADESGQTVTFTVTNSNNALFAVQPAVSSNGTLTFTPAANANGSATITITAQDNGGIANGGNDTSAPQTSSITVTPVNDEPSFTSGGNVSVNEDSGPYSAAWATAISAGPANESGQTVSFVVANDNNGLFSTQPAISPSGVLTFTPSANANGSATVTVYLTDDGGIANGGDDTSPTQTFTITVNDVNDAPSFTSGGDVTVNEDSGAYSAAWATGISAGPANESGQTVSFNTSNDNNALFAVQPAISPSGVLTFTLASDAFGSATVTVTLSDNGGVANGGVDTSAPQTFTITVNAVNDAPSFTGGGNVTVAEDSGAYSAPWASGISAGPANESGQTVSFNTSNDNNALFSVQPSISPAGVLSFTPAPNAYGTATVTVTLSDNGGIANGGVDTSAPQTFTITVNSVNDPPVAANDSWETEGNTELRVDVGSTSTPHVADTTPSGKGVADNDSDPVEGDPVTITGVVGCGDGTAPYDCAVTGGDVSLNANGSFSFKPSPGATSAGFQYTVTDGTDTATGTVSITIHDMIWYVNGSAPAGGDGTSDAPFNSFASLNGGGDVDGAGDYIFVHTSAVGGSIALEPSQKLWGQGIGLIIPRNLNGNGFPTTLVAPGLRPTVTAIAGDTVLVSNVTGVEIAGLNLVSPSGNAIDVTSSGATSASAAIYSNGVTASAGEGIDINAGSSVGTSVSINTTDVVAMGDGVNLLATDGAVVFSYSNGSVTSMTGSGIVVNGAAADSLVINGMANVTIGAGTPGQGISVNTARFDANAGTAAFDTVNAGTWTVATNASPTGGTAVSLTNVSGDLAWGTLSAYGTTGGVIVAGTGAYTGVAGMRVTNTGGAISATNGVGLRVTSATIAGTGLNFTSIASANAVNGIVLNNTGAGGLTVNGDGTLARNGSGGTINNISGDGMQLVNASNVTLRSMNITNTGANPGTAAIAQSSAGSHAIDMNGGSGLVLSGVLVDNPRGTGLLLLNVGGTNGVNNDSLITNLTTAAGHGIFVNNVNTNMTLFAFDDSTMSNNLSGNTNFFFANTGTSNMRLDVINGSVFENLATQAVTAAAGGTGATTGTLTTNIGGALLSNGNTFRNGAAGGTGENNVGILVSNGAAHVALVQNNLFDNIAETGLIANTSILRTQNNGGRLDAVVSDNTIQNINYAAGTGGRHVIGHIFEPLAFNASDYSNVEISRNVVTGVTFTGTNREFIFIDYRPNAAGGKIKILNNDVTFTNAGTQQAMELRFRQTNASTVSLQIDGNDVTHDTAVPFIDIDAEAAATVNSTVTNNAFNNPNASPGQMIDVATESATAVGCANISGNALTPGSITVNEILGTLNVTQASSAALSAANGGAVVTVGGSPAFGQPACMLP